MEFFFKGEVFVIDITIIQVIIKTFKKGKV